MLQSVHAQITRQALELELSARALRAVLKANLAQDSLPGQIGHDEFHFDNNAFEKSRAYIEHQRRQVVSALRDDHPSQAWPAFGRLIHAAQDFYAHSNYVSLWLARNAPPGGAIPREKGEDLTLPAALNIDPVHPDLIASPQLRSGKIYYPQEILYFIPRLRKLALSFLPRDSHAHMNLDSAECGPNFVYAYYAAIKRTKFEFEQLRSRLSHPELVLFTDDPRRQEKALAPRSGRVDPASDGARRPGASAGETAQISHPESLPPRSSLTYYVF